MNQKPKVSVIIASYNYGKYIDETILSVKNQTFQDFEIIVIDDCSSDPFTQEKIKEIAQDKTITLIQNSENKGVVYSRNYAISKASADYILCLDSDDMIRSDCLEKMYGKVDKYDIVGARVQEFGASNKVTTRTGFDKYTFCFKCTIHNSSLFKKSLWQEVGGYNENMNNGCEDYDFWLAMVEAGAKVTILKDLLIFYRIHGISRNTRASKHSEELSLNIVKNHPILFRWFLGQSKQKMKQVRRWRRVFCLSLALNLAGVIYLLLS